MCLAIPAQIESIDGIEARVDVGGVSRTVSVMFTPEARVGDYVYVHTGYAISVVDEAEALESLRLLRELAETYPVDELFYTTGDTRAPARGPVDP
jgi:hydrogenase expression/formation protein HypC